MNILNKIARRCRNFLANRKPKTMMPRQDLHAYWREPWKWDENNLAEDYVGGYPRTRFLISLLKDIPKSANILEIGCNCGRNLNGLWNEGYENLTGVEISPHAVEVMRTAHPEMKASVIVQPIEDAIVKMKDNEFDVVFTMAVLQHLPSESEWVMKEIARIAKTLITIEDEVNTTRRHRARNYKDVFEGLGMRQVQEMNCEHVDDLFDPSFNARIFTKV